MRGTIAGRRAQFKEGPKACACGEKEKRVEVLGQEEREDRLIIWEIRPNRRESLRASSVCQP